MHNKLSHCILPELWGKPSDKVIVTMKEIIIFFSLLTLFLIPCSAKPIGLFDFREANKFNNCTPYKCDTINQTFNRIVFNRTIANINAMELIKVPDDKLPDKVTICSTIYSDFREFGDKYTRTNLPHWAFVDGNGKPNLSLQVYHWKTNEVTLDVWTMTLPCNSIKCHWTRFGRL